MELIGLVSRVCNQTQATDSFMTTPLEISMVTRNQVTVAIPTALFLCFMLFNTCANAILKCVLLLGFYLALNMSGDKDGETAVLSTPVNIQAPTICVGFWYFMLGPSVAKLDLVVKMVRKNKVFSFYILFNLFT